MGQLHVVHSHLRGKATELFRAGHWLSHLSQRGHNSSARTRSRLRNYCCYFRLEIYWKQTQREGAHHFLCSDGNGFWELHHGGLVVHKRALRFRGCSFVHLGMSAKLISFTCLFSLLQRRDTFSFCKSLQKALQACFILSVIKKRSQTV